MKRFLVLICYALVATFILRQYFFETVSVASGSMEPTLFIGSHYLVNRFVYRLHEPKRGDIISFTSPVDQRTRFIKRVIAVPGDEVELREKKVYLNGKPVEEPYAVFKRRDERLVGDSLGPLKVPEGSVFVLGDNRDESFDSGSWKNPQTGEPIHFLPFKLIRGRLIQFT
jgi:signal peptidase I